MKNDSIESKKVGERVRIFTRGTTWYANYQFNGRQQRQSLNTDNNKTAIRKTLKLDRQLADGELPTKVEPATIAETIEAYKTYLVAERRSEKTKSKYWGVFDQVKSLAQTMRRSSLLQLDLPFIDEFRAQRAKTCQPKTIYTDTVIVRQLVKFGVTRRMIPHDPLLRLKLKNPTPQPYFDDAQIQQILSAARPPHDATFLLLAETGFRFGEAQWLSWADVDLKTNVIHVRAKEGWRPKTGNERAVPMSPKLREFLERRPRKGGWVLTAMPTAKYPSSDRRAPCAYRTQTSTRPSRNAGQIALLSAQLHLTLPYQWIEESVVRSWVGHVDPTIMRLYTHISCQISQDRIQRLGASENHKHSTEGEPQR